MDSNTKELQETLQQRNQKNGIKNKEEKAVKAAGIHVHLHKKAVLETYVIVNDKDNKMSTLFFRFLIFERSYK